MTAIRALASALVAGLVIGEALAACSTTTSPAGTGAAPTISPTLVAATPTVSQTLVTPTPSEAFGGATALIGGTHRAVQTEAGVTYYTNYFKPSFTIRPGAGWWMVNNIPTLTSFERGPHEPKGPPEYVVQLVSPTKVVRPGNSSLIPAPADLIAWLRARPDLILSAPTSVTVAGIQGSMVKGSLRPGAALNPEGIVNLICGELSECGYEGGQLIAAGPGALSEFVALNVRGDQVIIGLTALPPYPSTTQATFDAFLKTLAFPAP